MEKPPWNARTVKTNSRGLGGNPLKPFIGGTRRKRSNSKPKTRSKTSKRRSNSTA
jgi:hypothetical protein